MPQLLNWSVREKMLWLSVRDEGLIAASFRGEPCVATGTRQSVWLHDIQFACVDQ